MCILKLYGKFKSKIMVDISQRRAEPYGRVCICTPCFKTGGAYAPPLSMPHLKFEIVCFCPCWKKLSGGADGADDTTPLATSPILIFSRPPKIYWHVIYKYNPYLLLFFVLGKQRRLKPWGKGVMCPCIFKQEGIGSRRQHTPLH